MGRFHFATLLVLLVIIGSVDGLRAQNTLIPLPGRRGVAFDHAGRYLYVANDNGFVSRYDLTSHTLEPEYALGGGSLAGIDIAPDDSFLLVARSDVSNNQGTFHRIDFGTGVVTDIHYPIQPGELGGWDVAIASNGLALVTTTWQGYGVPNLFPLRQIDLGTNTITARNDVPGFWGSQGINAGSAIYRSADGSRFLLFEASSGHVFGYDAATNSFHPDIDRWALGSENAAAVSPDGTKVGIRLEFNASLESAENFSLIRTFYRADSGIAFDAVTPTLYTAETMSGKITAYDTGTFAEKYQLDIEEGIPPRGPRFASGSIVSSFDGHYIAVLTPSGIRLITIPSSPPPATPHPGVFEDYPVDLVFDHANQHLYIISGLGQVWPYNLQHHVLETPITLGGITFGGDIAPDDSFMLVSQYVTGMVQGQLQRIDLRTRAVGSINYDLIRQEWGGWDVAIASNGMAFSTVDFAGFGPVPVRQIDTRTNIVSVRTDAPGSDPFGHGVYPQTRIQRSADHSRLLFVEGQLADAPMFTYDARTDAFGSSTKTGYPSESASAAVNRSGTALGYRIGDNIFLQSAPGFSLLHTFAGSQGGITFDGAKDILYLANGITSQLVGYDINTFAERIRINIGQTIPFYTFQFDVGTMEASHDGRYVALITPTNVRLMNTTTRSSVAITIPTLPTGTPTPAPFPTPKPTPAPTPTPPVAGLAVAPAAVGKGGTATFTISLGATTSQDVTVNYSMSGNAGLGADYALSGTLNQVVIPAGQSSANVTLMVTTTKTKGREKATMTIGAGSGYQLPTSGKKSKPNPPKLTVTINNR